MSEPIFELLCIVTAFVSGISLGHTFGYAKGYEKAARIWRSSIKGNRALESGDGR